MKKILTILVAVIILAACPNEPSSESSAPSHYGETLKLSGQMYTRDMELSDINADSLGGDEVDIAAIFDLFTGLTVYNKLTTNETLTISDLGMGGSGKIQNGNLSYSIGKPADGALLQFGIGDITSIDGVIYTDVVIQPQDAKASFLTMLVEDNSGLRVVTREKINLSIANVTVIVEAVSYMYVDQNVTITAQGATYTDEDIIGFPLNLTTEKINLNLKKGWNALHSTISITPDLSTVMTAGLDGLEFNGSLSISIDNPSSMYWVLTAIDDELLSSF